MSHYEQRLEADLEALRHRVRRIGEWVVVAQEHAVQALRLGDHQLAYRTILGDLRINREIRAADAECHAFVARHLPSAGHLRFVSSVLRLNVILERIGDYAVTMCRSTVQLSTPPSALLERDLELMAGQSQSVLKQALEGWNTANADLARGTIAMVKQASGMSDKVFDDLSEGQDGSLPLRDLFNLLMVFNRLGRVISQAKNICEETLFSVSGETKAPKLYRVLFVDERDQGLTQIAAAYARKAFPESGHFESAGWNPADQLDPRSLIFLERHSLDHGDLSPSKLSSLPDDLATYHVVVSLGSDLRQHVATIPFHTALLEWDVGSIDFERLDQERVESELELSFKKLVGQIGELMETLRGEGAC